MKKDLLENMRKFFRYVSEADEPSDDDVPNPISPSEDDEATAEDKDEDEDDDWDFSGPSQESAQDVSLDDETKQAIKNYHKALASGDEAEKEKAFKDASNKLLSTIAKSSDKDSTDWASRAYLNKKTAAKALRRVYDPKSDKFALSRVMGTSRGGKRHGGVDKEKGQARMEPLQKQTADGGSFDIASAARGAGGLVNTGDIKATGQRVLDRLTNIAAAKQDISGQPRHEFDKLVKEIPGEEKDKMAHLKRVLRVFAGYSPRSQKEKELADKLSDYVLSSKKRVKAEIPGVQKSILGQGGNTRNDEKMRAAAIAGSIFTYKKDPTTNKLRMAIRDLAAHTSKNPTEADPAELARRILAQIPVKSTPEQRKLLQPRASKEAQADDLVSPEKRLGLGSVEPHSSGLPSQLNISKQRNAIVGLGNKRPKGDLQHKGFVGALARSLSDEQGKQKGLIARLNMKALKGSPEIEKPAAPTPEVQAPKMKHGITLPEHPEHSTAVENALDTVVQMGTEQPKDLSKIVSWRRAQDTLKKHNVDMSKFKPDTAANESVIFNKIFNESVHKALARLEALLG